LRQRSAVAQFDQCLAAGPELVSSIRGLDRDRLFISRRGSEYPFAIHQGIGIGGEASSHYSDTVWRKRTNQDQVRGFFPDGTVDVSDLWPRSISTNDQHRIAPVVALNS